MLQRNAAAAAMASVRAAPRSGVRFRQQVVLTSAETAVIATKVLPTLFRVETALNELQVRLNEVRANARCFASLDALDACKKAIVGLMKRSWANQKLSARALREMAFNAFKRMRTALFPGASKKPAKRPFFGHARAAKAVLGFLDDDARNASAARASRAARAAASAAIPPPPPPPSPEEAAALEAAKAARAAARAVEAAETRRKANEAIAAGTVARNAEAAQLLAATRFVKTKQGGVVVASTTTTEPLDSASVSFVAPSAAAVVPEELLPVDGFISRRVSVGAGRSCTFCLSDASLSVTVLELPAGGVSTFTATPVRQEYVFLFDKLQLLERHAVVSARHSAFLSFRNGGTSPMLLQCNGEVTADGGRVSLDLSVV